ncbi:hypothetical protein RIR_jg14197.t1 [Rhizophagus irregularis DAOM 181602=DAOM 197198]|nr:hypothetical protein RIR_jg14197.t1 [Rhizophagus irregularis DAOM 181602=DAOM 197198]
MERHFGYIKELERDNCRSKKGAELKSRMKRKIIAPASSELKENCVDIFRILLNRGQRYYFDFRSRFWEQPKKHVEIKDERKLWP